MRSSHALDRTGICACGVLVQQHFTIRNAWIGCDGARRINEAFQASAGGAAPPIGELEVRDRARERDSQVGVR